MSAGARDWPTMTGGFPDSRISSIPNDSIPYMLGGFSLDSLEYRPDRVTSHRPVGFES